MDFHLETHKAECCLNCKTNKTLGVEERRENISEGSDFEKDFLNPFKHPLRA
jgi:hypothetical protein